MEITEVRIKLMEDSDDRLQAFCSITFDNSFVVRDLKIIDGANGPFVAMPSRKLTAHCQQCGSKNHLKAGYCNHCGVRLREDRTVRDSEGRAKLYADIAHPINSACREMIQNRVIAEFRTELDRSKQPGYVSRYDDEYDDDVDAAGLEVEAGQPGRATRTQVQPAQTQPPAPHILPTQQPAAGTTGGAAPAADTAGSETSGPPAGPHFSHPPAPREAAKESQQKPKTNKGDFGAGIF